MSEPKPVPGTIGWIDLTTSDAPRIRAFYERVAGWVATPVPMGDYEDWAMGPPDAPPAGGVCHARGANADQPGGWTIYIVVEDLDASLASCEELGGRVVVPTREMGPARYAVIEDPSGAVSALYQP